MFSKTSNGIKLFGVLALVAIMFLSLSSAVSAADYVQLAPIPGTATELCAEPPCGTNLSTYLTGMFKISIAATGVLAFLMIVWGGFTYLSTDVIYGKEEGKTRIERALGGLILALASYIILNTINPQLVSLNLDFGPAAETKAGLNAPPANFVSSDTKPEDLAALRAQARGFISENVNDRIQALDAKAKTGNLTSEEEREQKDLEVVRQGTVAINKIYVAQANINAGLDKFGLTSSLAREARAGVEQLRTEVDERIAVMSAEGATIEQMAVVRNRFNATVQSVERCISYLSGNTRDQFNSYCK